jgi:SHS2 domain-containing protein
VPYEISGRGSDLAIAVTGRDACDCLDAALAGFAAALADVAGATERREDVAVGPGEPAELLLDLVDEAVLRLDAHGELAVGLADCALEHGVLRGRLRLVALAQVAVHGVAPKAATWHRLRLEPVDGGWAGEVMLDL